METFRSDAGPESAGGAISEELAAALAAIEMFQLLESETAAEVVPEDGMRWARAGRLEALGAGASARRRRRPWGAVNRVP